VAVTLFFLFSGVYFVVSGVQFLPEDLAAARGDGVPGTFTAEEVYCSRGGCSWDGSFVSDDGFTVFKEAWIDADAPPYEPGDTIPALWAGDEDGYVYPAGGSNEWLWTVLSMVIGAGFVFFAGTTLLAAWFRRRA
jgi:hypothetical protein